jgi:general secretion pathway protein L
MADFLRWWGGELAAMLPASWRDRLFSRDTAYVGVEGDEWSAFRPVAGRLVQAGRVNLAALDSGGRRGAFHRLLAEGQGAAGNVWLILPPEAVLVRDVHMPLAAEEALRDAVGFELDRLTPLPAEHAWFDYRVTGRDTASQRLTLRLAVAARAPVESRMAELRELGATVLGVCVADDVASAPTPLNLLPPERRDRPATSNAAIASRALAVVVAVLAVAALVFPILQKRDAVIALHPRLEKAKAGADVAERVAKEIEKIAAEHNFVLAKKQGLQPVVVILENLTRLLPDTTWVQQLDVKTSQKAREVQIAGETGSSSQLIEALEQSGMFANAGFKSPLTKGTTPNTERFVLAAEVKPRLLPEPMPDSALAAPAAGTTVTGGSGVAPPPATTAIPPPPPTQQSAPAQAGSGAATVPQPAAAPLIPSSQPPAILPAAGPPTARPAAAPAAAQGQRG